MQPFFQKCSDIFNSRNRKKNTAHVLTHHWGYLPFHRPAPSFCRARAPKPPAACEEGWSPHHPAVAEQTQM